MSSGSRVASFDTEWSPRDYLRDYYTDVEADERETIPFFVRSIEEAAPAPRVLFFGAGPTLHHVFLAAPTATRIDVSDYLVPNLVEIERWRDDRPGAHDWRQFVRLTLQSEGIPDPADEAIAERQDLTRRKLNVIRSGGDAGLADPLGRRRRGAYPVVFSAYCADSATSSKDVWERWMLNIASLVSPGGLFVTAALRNCPGYRVGARTFPAAGIDELDMARVLSRGFDPERVRVEVRHVPEHRSAGYSGIVLARAWKCGR